MFHIFLVKSRNASAFTHGLFRNEITLWGVVIEILIILLIVFAPSSEDVLFTRPFPGRFWALLVISPVLLCAYQEGRKAWIRAHPRGLVKRFLHW